MVEELIWSVITPWGVGIGFPYPSSLDEGQSPTHVILCLVYFYILLPTLCSKPRSRRFLVLGPAAIGQSVSGNTR